MKQAVTKSESRLLESADEIKFCIYWPVGWCITYFIMWSFGGQPEQRPHVSHSLAQRVRGEKPTILTDERGGKVRKWYVHELVSVRPCSN